MTTQPARRSAAALGAALALLVGLASPTAAAANNSNGTLENTFELMNSRGSDLPQQVTTASDRVAGDGAGMTYSISSTLPDGDLGRLAVHLADGAYAVPQNLDTSPDTTPDSAAVADALARAQTFVDAGNKITWDASRPSPLNTKDPVHKVTSAPHAVTCSTFVGMVLAGLTYESSTYVADKNTPVGTAVDFQQTLEGSDLWQANHLAAWFYAHGDMWLDTTGEYQPGDVLFYSKQDPEGKESQVRSGSVPTYFANVYHTAIYLGDGKVAQATQPGRGVTIDTLKGSLKDDVTLVARPYAASGANAPAAGAKDPAVQNEAQQAPEAQAAPAPAQGEAAPQGDQPADQAAGQAPAQPQASADPAAEQTPAPNAERPSAVPSAAVVAADPPRQDPPGMLARTGAVLPLGALLISVAGGFFFLFLARRRQQAS